MRARCVALLTTLAIATAWARPATAQLHWDASAQVGATKRFLVARPPGGDDAGIGPSAQVAAHVALVPLVRIGGWLAHDISPVGGDVAARAITSGGVRAKAMSPWPRGALRTWLFAGIGYAGVYARSYPTTVLAPAPPGEGPPTRVDGEVLSAGGSFFEVPLGVGASYKLRKPWELVAELGLRLGFGHTGSVYTDPGRQVVVPGQRSANILPSGTDRLALGLTVGVLVDL
jgi:hypothetical protein